MQTWPDCLAALRAGAEPDQVLSRVRALLARLPEPESPPTPTPTARLYHALPEAGGQTLQLPYLRPPFSLREALRAEEKSFYDSECRFDVVGLFAPRFVEPPPHGCGADQGGEDFVFADETSEVAALPLNGVGEHGVERQRDSQEITCSASELDRYARQLETYFTMSTTSREDAVDGLDSIPAFNTLTADEWSVVFYRMDMTCTVGADALETLVRAVNQPTLSLFVLRTMFPFLVAGGTENPQACLRLVSTAAGLACLSKLKVREVRDVLEIYRGMDGGLVGALAQLRVVGCIEASRNHLT